MLTVRIAPALKSRVQVYADALGLSLNALVLVALADYLAMRAVPVLDVADGVPVAASAEPVVPASAAPVVPAPVRGRTVPLPSSRNKKRR